YQDVDALIINKIDLLPYVDFDMEYFKKGVQMLNPDLITFPISCKTGEGIQPWVDWVKNQIMPMRSD
ncbi:MAG: hydrogenase accessory protein HypB, partial [Chloroflexi bacterium]|nr:hydrogenase accessory protein HypB [Chloroflexota bacterium]